jgi:glycosyltransferase involved in cell wall biosynthesis
MAAGVPVLASDTPVSREIGGDAAHYADALDPEALARGLEAVLFDAGLRRELVRAGSARVATFGWDACARRHLELFDEVVGRRR